MTDYGSQLARAFVQIFECMREYAKTQPDEVNALAEVCAQHLRAAFPMVIAPTVEVERLQERLDDVCERCQERCPHRVVDPELQP